MSKHSKFTVKGKPFLSLGGQTHNSSSYVLKDMERAWKSVKALGGNTVATPICWDAFEAEEDKFNIDYVKDLILEARKENLKLILLWFATWKNGTMEYSPAWVKKDKERFQRVICFDGSVTSVLSSHSKENWKADCKAFCKLMQLLKEFDGSEQTVIGVQIENEAGIIGGTKRDFSPIGQAAYQDKVPNQLIQYANEHSSSTLAGYWKENCSKLSGNWAEVFGSFGAEAVTAWSIANYIDSIAFEGKKIYDIFLYTNVWLDGGTKGSGWDLAGLDYPSGCAVIKALDIWYCACKSLDTIAPDNYQGELNRHYEVSDTYSHPELGFPLYVPESAAANLNASLMFYAIGEKGAIGYHIFGTEDVLDNEGAVTERGEIMSRSMHMLSAIDHLLFKYEGTNKLHSLVQHTGEEGRYLKLQGWKCKVCYAGNGYGWNVMDYHHLNDIFEEGKGIDDSKVEKARGILIQVDENDFYLVGHKIRLLFNRPEPVDGHIPILLASGSLQANNTDYIQITEGHFDEEEHYIIDRVRSGDEARHGIWAQSDCGVIHFQLN
ncbi:MAG TPA: DUF5597 domain-containing protein [Clostridiaceae bacterium]